MGEKKLTSTDQITIYSARNDRGETVCVVRRGDQFCVLNNDAPIYQESFEVPADFLRFPTDETATEWHIRHNAKG